MSQAKLTDVQRKAICIGSSLVIAVLAVISMRPVMPSGFVGVDTYPILLTSRYDSPADLWRVVGSNLMPGFVPFMVFYRPVAGVIWGACYGVWGLDAGGYLWLNQVFHALNALLLIPLAISLFGRPGRTIGLVAAAVFALYPLSVENVPVVSRMPDLLAANLILLTLITHGASAKWRRVAPILALLAYGVKEVAFLIPMLMFFFDLSRGKEWKDSLRRGIPYAVLLVLYLSIRQSVLGEIGGYRSIEKFMIRPGDLLTFVRTVFVPFEPLETYRSGGIFSLLVRGGAGLLAALLWTRRGPRTPVERGMPPVALFLVVWIAMAVLIHLPTRLFERRYVYLASLPSSLLLSWLVFASGAGKGGRILMAVAAFLIVWQVSFTPLLGGYQEWKIGDRLAREYLGRIDPELVSSNLDLETTDCPSKIISRPSRVPYVSEAPILSRRSLKAYMALRYPGYSGEILGRPRTVFVDPSEPGSQSVR